MDPRRGLWYFLKAECLKEIRMKGINKFTKEEIRNLETLVRITRATNTFYLCYTAEEFINIANNLSPSSDENLYNRAAELYCKVLKNSEHHSLFILSRLLFGYCQLPSHLRTMSINKIFNETLLSSKDNRDANLALGAYYEKVNENFVDARNHYSRALELGSYEAGIALVKLKQKSYGYCDLFYETTKMREIFKNDPRKQQEILCQLGSNYYSYGYAIGAIYCWHIAATLDPYARELQDHRNWLRPSKKINIYRSMSLEANYALKRIYNWSDLDMKKPAQQQTVKLLQLAVELCSNFYKAEQDKSK
ncbi:unnamed protein product [Timema podura]|uniref:Tetratricopeptide repeat protein n=1 Tax=Timema podura TaxID=61482 RepID=A0ABN7PPV5_TIMPD|nr:unnamed protein product [Timema podura]